MRAVDDVLFRPLDVVQVKGKRHKTRIYQPLCMVDEADQALLDKLELHRQGMDHYFNDQREQAGKIFRELADDNEADDFYTIMLKKLNPA